MPLYLLDTNIPATPPRTATSPPGSTAATTTCASARRSSWASAASARWRRLGKPPTVCHMNEGHSAFLGLERIRALMEEHGLDFAAAREACSPPAPCFTTHTPVPAGNDVFAPRPRSSTTSSPWPTALGIDRDELPALGRRTRRPRTSAFGMTVLAMRTGDLANGVSKLHGDVVAEDVAQASGRDLPVDEVPITSITNGVHTAQLARRRHARAVRPLPRRRPGTSGPTTRPSGSGSSTSPTPSCGGRTSAAASGWWLFAREPRCRQQLEPPRRAPGRDRPGRGGARPRRADHRLRPPLRDLQARRR